MFLLIRFVPAGYEPTWAELMPPGLLKRVRIPLYGLRLKPPATSRASSSNAARKSSGESSLGYQSLALVRLSKIERGTERHNPGRVDIGVSDIVVPLDMINIDGLGDPGLLVKIAKVGVEIRIVDDSANVALEVAMINRIEADKRAKQPPIRFNDAIAE